MKAQRLSAAAVIGLALLLYSTGAAAQLTNQGMLDQVVTAFATRAASWQTVIMNAATWLFWTLGTISLVWTGGMLLLRGGGIQDFFSEFVRFIMFFGFFLWLLRNGPAFASSIIQSLQMLGEQASGVSSVTPSGIVDIGFMIWRQAITNLSIWSPVDSIVGLALSAAIMVLLAAVAVNMMLVLVSAWILMYAGIFFLGFGGSRWTSDMAISYYKTVLGVGMQLLTMVILVGIGVDLLNTFYAKMNKGTLNFDELGVMMVFCVTLLMLITRVPPLVASIVSGGTSSVGGTIGAGTVVGAAMAGASVASAAASMAGGAMMGAAQNMAGGASAIKEAFAKANAAGGESAGAMAAPAAGGASSGGMAAGGAGGGSSGGGTASSTPYAQAAGFAESLGGGSSMAGGVDTQQASGGQAEAKGGGDAGQKAQAGGQADGAGATQAGGQTSGSSMAGRVATAAAKAGKVAAGAGANLAAGIGSVMAAKADQMAANFQAGVEQTVGGKVAAAIRQSAEAEAPSFGGDSISAPAGDAEEIAAFVNRPETRA
jgi:type IV secretion system protein TrbL